MGLPDGRLPQRHTFFGMKAPDAAGRRSNRGVRLTHPAEKGG